MSKEMDQIASALADLGKRIDAKVKELGEQGILHGPAREAAANLKMQHERARAKAASGHVTAAGAVADDLTADIETLKDTFEHWMASIDADSERKHT